MGKASLAVGLVFVVALSAKCHLTGSVSIFDIFRCHLAQCQDSVIKGTVLAVGCCQAGALGLKPPSQKYARRQRPVPVRAWPCQEGQDPFGHLLTLSGGMEGLEGYRHGGLWFFRDLRFWSCGVPVLLLPR